MDFNWEQIRADSFLLKELSLSDFKKKYLGSYLGILWPFIHPIVTILIYWFVFDVGLKGRPVHDVPFVLWLATGIVPWFYFSESVIVSSNSLMEYSFLLKNITFRPTLIPLIKLISNLSIHLFSLGLLMVVAYLYHFPPQLSWLQVPYYLLCLIALTVGLSMGLSALALFIKDIPNMVTVAIQFGFWFTPIVWSEEIVPPWVRTLLHFNPMWYIVEGFRETFIWNKFFWQNPRGGLIFWGLTLAINLVGFTIFKKLRPSFGDTL